jgi:hypothetical protein
LSRLNASRFDSACAVRTRREDRERQRRHGPDAVLVLLGEHPREMLLRDVRDFVAEHRRELRLGLRGQQQTRVHADVAARHRERVDRVVADAEERELGASAGAHRDEAPADRREVVVDLRIVEIRR